MKTLNTVLFSIILFSFITCGSSKEVMNNDISENKVTNNETTKTMTNEGYLEGIIIQELKTNMLLDPINLDKDFKVNNEKVWFTYSSLRMQNRCGNVRPVSIDDIKKREE